MREGRGVFLTIFVAMFFAPLVVFASYAAGQYPNVTPVERMHPNGKYTVYVGVGDKWQEAGSISFDKYFRERALDLTPYVSDKGDIRVRLQQQGGGAAQIDSVSLGGGSPIDVRGAEDGLKKLGGKDFDVIDAYNKRIEMTFSGNRDSSVLALTARVEGTRIGEVPFHFPIANLYKKMGAESKFYTYDMGTKETASPFFKEYSLTGSGHPSGYTYGWVRHDKENLYVKMDFTPDDTMDGDKDYAAVYARTGAGVKEFRVSMKERRWGDPTFTYTDKVSYQHKVYDFTIPLKEIGVMDAGTADTIALAFAAYGTAAPLSPLLSPYTTVAPVIDGNYYSTPNEWPGNTSEAALEISGPIHTLVYAKNNDSSLFMLVNAASVSGDYTEDDNDHCSVYLYNNGKGLRVTVFGNGTTYCESTSSVSSPLVWNSIPCPAGVAAADGFGPSPEKPASHRIYEFRLPLGFIGALPGEVIYFASPYDQIDSLPYDYNGGSSVYNIWPPGSTAALLNTWGRIQLGRGPASIPTVNKWGIILFVFLAGLGAAYCLRRRGKTSD